jgi:hypothetical protein
MGQMVARKRSFETKSSGKPTTETLPLMDESRFTLAAQGMKVRMGMEASGQARWFERLVSELQFRQSDTTRSASHRGLS